MKLSIRKIQPWLPWDQMKIGAEFVYTKEPIGTFPEIHLCIAQRYNAVLEVTWLYMLGSLPALQEDCQAKPNWLCRLQSVYQAQVLPRKSFKFGIADSASCDLSKSSSESLHGSRGDHVGWCKVLSIDTLFIIRRQLKLQFPTLDK